MIASNALGISTYIFYKCTEVQPYIYVVDDPWVQTVQHYFQLNVNWLKGQVKVILLFTANLDPAFCEKKENLIFHKPNVSREPELLLIMV